MMYVMHEIFRSHHYVDLWELFLKLVYGMSHATDGGSALQQMVLPSMHPIDLGS
jgi:hypothetical protein